MTYADSSFLPAFDFIYLYKDHPLITATRNEGISQKEYLKFLLSEQHPLGEKVALVEALAAYFEFMDADKNPACYDYFFDYTKAFREKLSESASVSPERQLLETLMDDYQTFEPNIRRYNQLADELPESLAAQSIKVIAFAYDVLYNDRWELVDEYVNNYLNPYKNAWKNYRQDIRPKAFEYVDSWLRFIEEKRKDAVPEGVEVAQRSSSEETFISDDGTYHYTRPEDAAVYEYFNEDGAEIRLVKTVSGKNILRDVTRRDTVHRTGENIRYVWDEKNETWQEFTKDEFVLDAHKNSLSTVTCKWNKFIKDWSPDEKTEGKYEYDATGLVYYARNVFEWNDSGWIENYREEATLENGKLVSGKVYVRAEEDGEFFLYDEYPKEEDEDGEEWEAAEEVVETEAAAEEASSNGAAFASDITLSGDEENYSDVDSACMYSLKAINAEDRLHRTEYYREAASCFEKACRADPAPLLLFNWSWTLSSMAEYLPAREADSLYRRAEAILASATDGMEENFTHHYMRGICLQSMGNLKRNAEADTLFRKSTEHLEKALEYHLNEKKWVSTGKAMNTYDALQYSFARLAALRKGKERDKLFEKAIACGHRATAHGASFYNQAVVYLLKGDMPQAFSLLERTLKQKEKTVRWVETDTDWDSVHKHRQYRQLMKEYAD
jgi:hypothetical protein